MRPTPPYALVLWALGGLGGGWLLHPIGDRLGDPPLVTWAQPVALAVVAGVVGVVARATWRTLHVQRDRLEPHQAVNRLVLARASAIAGALVGGGYLGYALTWLGNDAPLAEQRLVRSLAAAVAGVAIVVAALLLERACRVRSDGEGN